MMDRINTHCIVIKTSNKRISMKVYFSFSNYVDLYGQTNQDYAVRVADQMQLHWSKNWMVADVERKEVVNQKIIGIVFFLHAHEWNYTQLKSMNLFLDIWIFDMVDTKAYELSFFLHYPSFYQVVIVKR